MANAICTVKIMPTSPDVDLKGLETAAKEKIAAFAGEGDTRTEIEPIAFGLKALKIIFVMDEDQGSPDPVAEEISRIKGVNSAEISDVRRAVG
ncbi:MAG TPA: elongation factor 1-beta [Candidatus Nanoarchaeia archaeon]|nr:elongation factor 1-beta [Candidatus Nanoarchaeia archaeon]